MPTEKTYIVVPVYNDWESFDILLENIAKLPGNFEVVAIDDGSTAPVPEDFKHKVALRVVHLKINVGHQRAIAIGLQYIHAEVDDAAFVIVMDGDGEDRPGDIPELLKKARNSSKIVFAKRKKRSESVTFKTGYFFYKKLFRFLTGQEISFGNYSAVPRKMLTKMVHLNNIWNHYSGAIIQSRIPYDYVLLDRGKRYKGVSKMNLNSLILHGLSSIAVYFDFLSLRILKVSLYGIALCVLSMLYIFYQKLFTDTAIPGWASSLILIISGIILQLFSVTLIVLLLQLSSRKNISLPNPNIYREFIEDVTRQA